MEFIMSARGKAQVDTEYLTLEAHGLNAFIAITGGNGSAKNPFIAKIQISNKSRVKWSGVIHVEVPFKKLNPRYFLPAFMYGKNRGECPLNVPNEFPRMREELRRPASPWWMVRGDRLSHPIALVYDTDKIYGFSASPYFTSNNRIKQH